MIRRIPAIVLMVLFIITSLTACAPEIGSEAWCQQMKDKPKGDWSSNEAADFAKHCLFN